MRDAELLEQVGRTVEERGLAAVAADLPAVVDVARRSGASPVLLAVLTDETEVDVVRERALGRLATVLARSEASTWSRFREHLEQELVPAR